MRLPIFLLGARSLYPTQLNLDSDVDIIPITSIRSPTSKGICGALHFQYEQLFYTRRSDGRTRIFQRHAHQRCVPWTAQSLPDTNHH
jgi:hypothetical protein